MSYARIAIHDLRPGTVNTSVGRAEAELLPLLRGQPGFLSYAVYKISEGQVASVSAWETREAADRAVELAEDWIHSSLTQAVLSSQVVVGELAFQSEGPSLTAGEEAPPPIH